MNLISQLLTIMRGSAREAAETVIDANALRLLEHQIYECESAIQRAKSDLTRVVAQKISIDREIQALRKRIVEREAKVSAALSTDDEASALCLAELIASDESRLEQEQEDLRKLQTHENEVQGALRSAILQVRDHRRELGLFRATRHAHRAAARLDDNRFNLGAQLGDIRETTARIRDSQQAVADHLMASNRVAEYFSEGHSPRVTSGDGSERNRTAAHAVLERIRQRGAKPPPVTDGASE